MSTLVLMCGLSFSGKATLARLITSKLRCVHISLDDINEERGLWGGRGIATDEWVRTHDIAHTRVRESLAGGNCVVVDDTSSLRFLRDRFRGVCVEGEHHFTIVYVETTVEEIAERMIRAAQSGERRSVDPGVFDELVKSFEPPNADEHPLVYASGDDAGSLLTRLVALC